MYGFLTKKRMKILLKYFSWSIGVLIMGLIFAFVRGESMEAGLGFKDIMSALIIASLEVSLSFDNAVINATKLEKMTHKWRVRFLTWGIAIAVFGMRFLFPILIVAVFSGLPATGVLDLALHNPDEYARHLHDANVGISSFGGTFLLLLCLEFMFDRQKSLHWIPAERFLHKLGRKKHSAVVLTAAALFAVQPWIAQEMRIISLLSGFSGIAIHLLIHGISTKLDSLAQNQNAFALKHAGLAAFVYLELIDASFSLDGVLGAFALTKDVVIIAIGLAVGAFFVRSLTIVLVEEKTLNKLVYLTNGAYWAIGSLAVIMLCSTFTEIHEVITGSIGLLFILASLVSSLLVTRKNG